MFENECSNLQFKFVDGAASVEDIVFSTTDSANMYVQGAVRVAMARCSTEGTLWIGSEIFAGIAKTPAFLALTEGWNKWLNLADSSTYIYTLLGRSWPLNLILVIFTGCFRRP